MKTQTTSSTATAVWDIEHERADGDSWVASFESEIKTTTPAPPSQQPWRQVPAVAIGVCGTLIAAWFVWQTWTATPAVSAPLTPVTAMGTADFKTLPEGASISINGTERGVTPLRLSLA